MKGMMAAGLAKLSLYVPYPPEQFCFNLFFCIMVLHNILYVKIKGSTSFKKLGGGAAGGAHTN